MIVDILAFLALVAAAAYPLTKNFWHDTLGLGRQIEQLNNKGQCEQIPELQACEDSYFHPETGLLYLACAASVESRSNWMPGFQKFVQPSTSDYIAILDTRGSGSYASRIQKIEIKDFFEDAFRDEGRQEGTLNLHAIGIEADKTSTKGSNIRIHLNNHKPYYNQDGTINASSYLGANSTIEVFTSKLGSSTFNHLKTISSPSIVAPNSIAPLNSETFLFTNDHDVKTAWDRDLKAMIQASGNVGFCDEKTCGIALEKRHFPNGIVKSEKDGLIYLASSTKGHVQTFRWEEGKQRLVLVDTIYTSYPADNLSVDEHGDVWVAAFPSALKMFAHTSGDPRKNHSPSTVLKISRFPEAKEEWKRKYRVEKMFEDDGNVASGITKSVYDVRTHKLIMTGILSSALTVCQLP